jgi:hypothetical protein
MTQKQKMYAVVRSHEVKEDLNWRDYPIYTQEMDITLCKNLSDALSEYNDKYLELTRIEELLEEEKDIEEGKRTHHIRSLPESECIQIVQIINGKLHFTSNFSYKYR